MGPLAISARNDSLIALEWMPFIHSNNNAGRNVFLYSASVSPASASTSSSSLSSSSSSSSRAAAAFLGDFRPFEQQDRVPVGSITAATAITGNGSNNSDNKESRGTTAGDAGGGKSNRGKRKSVKELVLEEKRTTATDRSLTMHVLALANGSLATVALSGDVRIWQ